MNPGSEVPFIAFEGDRAIASGNLRDVVSAAKATLDRRKEASILIFDGITGGPIDIDFRGTIEAVLARLPGTPVAPIADAPVPSAPRGPGRPKLGVVAREVTLLPRHWEWLNAQRGGASVALRKLVDEARRASGDRDRERAARDAAYRFMSAMAGDRPGFEEASRALFAGDRPRFEQHTVAWPEDIRAYAIGKAFGFTEERPSDGNG
jgi:uncharacterized protein